MKKNTKTQREKHPDSGSRTYLNIAIAVGIVALLFLIPAVSGLLSRQDPAETAPDPEGMTTDQTANTFREPEIRALSSREHTLGNDLFLTEILAVTGNFPEEGGSEYRENALCIRIRNGSEQTLEYLTADLSCGGNTYTFAVSTLPPGESVLAWDTSGQSAPEKTDGEDVSVGYCIFFREEPILPDSLQIAVENGTLSVTNVSGQDITNDFFLYYKNRLNGEFWGGITYRVRISGGLKSGETYNAYAPNASKARTKVLFANDAS